MNTTANGIICAKCKQWNKSDVIESRIHNDLRIRTRQCVCGFRWKTVEIDCWTYIQKLEGKD